MMIRVIVMDLDETLIALDKQIPQENAAAIRAAQEAGIQVVFATARAWSRTEAIYRETGLTTPAIVSSGARLVDGNGRDLWTRTIPYQLAREVALFGEEQEIGLRFYVGDEIWNNEFHVPNLPHPYGEPVERISERLVSAPYQIYSKGRREVELLTERFGMRGEGFVSNVLTYSDGIPEVCLLHPLSTKGEAVAALCAQWGVPREEVMAIGDSRNDLSMIEWAGTGVAMAWASEEVRRRADLVTSSGNDAGVAEAIYKALAENKTPTRS